MTQSWDPVWEAVFKSSAWGKYPAESLIRFVARNYYKQDRANTRLMEIGCGPGANVWFFAKEGFQAFGIDGSPTAIEQASQRMKMEGLAADLQVGDIIQLPYPDSYFDAVVDVECLCCNSLLNTKIILNEIHRVLKPGGKLYSRTFTDKMHVGKNATIVGPNEYTGVTEGPLAGKGFIRLTPKNSVNGLLGDKFDVVAIDQLDWTTDNEHFLISEVIIIADKK